MSSPSSPQDQSRPSPAEQARTAVACARVAGLTTYPRAAPFRPHATSVVLEQGEGGLPVVRLAREALAVAHLLARPLVTVQVAPPGCPAVTLHGSVHRLPRSGDGQWHYRLEVAAVRVGQPRPRLVAVEQYLAARPDPLHREAPAALRHLARRHADELSACLRARGHDVLWVEPQALDSRGLDVAVVGHDGVELVRLPFPRPVSRLHELGAGLAAPLLCRCDLDAETYR